MRPTPTFQVSGPDDAPKPSTATSERYAAAIKAHSELSKEDTLFPGINYRQLAQFLKYSQLNLLPDSSSISSATSNKEECATSVTIHTLSGKDRNIKTYDESDGHLKFATEYSHSSNDKQLIFLHGLPSAAWCNTLGGLHRIDPEFFRRHLDFIQAKDYHDLPALPSSSRNIISLRITTIGERTLGFSQKQVQQARDEEIDIVRKHQRTLSSKALAGESIVRKYSIYNETTFAIEQNISICVKKKNSSWVVLLCLDTGRDLAHGPSGPWLSDEPSLENSFLPVIQHFPKMALRAHKRNISQTPTAKTSHTLQSASLLSSNYGSSLDRSLMSGNLMYALTELFAFVAASECEFLNMMECQINREFRMFESHMKWSLGNLRYYKESLDEHSRQIEVTLKSMTSSDLFEHSKVSQLAQPQSEPAVQSGKDHAKQENIPIEAVQTLTQDFQHLLSQASRLADKCVEGTTMIVNHAMLEGSSKAIQQAERAGRLTLLAFFFVPLSLVTSFFGMNFKEFGTGVLSMWWALVLSVPILLISVMLCFWENIFSVTR